MPTRSRLEVSASGNGSTIDLAKLDRVHVNFGPHHFVDIVQEGGRIRFVLGVTHHGFAADATDVPSQLESIIDDIRASHPTLTVD